MNKASHKNAQHRPNPITPTAMDWMILDLGFLSAVVRGLFRVVPGQTAHVPDMSHLPCEVSREG